MIQVKELVKVVEIDEVDYLRGIRVGNIGIVTAKVGADIYCRTGYLVKFDHVNFSQDSFLRENQLEPVFCELSVNDRIVVGELLDI